MPNSSIINTPLSSQLTYPGDFEASPPYAPNMPRFISRDERLRFEQRQMAERVFGGPLANPMGQDQDLIHWSCWVWGMAGSAFDGMTISMQLSFPSNYPYVPPICIIHALLPHPHIDDMNRLWSRVLSGPYWDPEMTVDMVLQHVRLVLRHTCPHNSPCIL
ncbi:hypothetical protein N7448_009392 [Penicillium atrosanguineum]|uniref:Uncharacterized protein n=1 Tax=Penicillium atrosanguineum TaxID=1132637 RepID=A0A9W9KW36_9EURO|nr:hypothetical protein N7448_009392 [Penicillium atrosanguineum]KAJ5141927.1 hypothetical protein N7526_002922 [Penicillium atrosanguineum]KAJ5321212.1 hypothetical protein N7476_004214 [Penicillium atrosanguineum]